MGLGSAPESSASKSSASEASADVGPAHDPLAPPTDSSADPLLELRRLAAVGTLARGAAHDFNNVLGVILGYVELARMGAGEEQSRVQRQLASALDSIGRARALADRLLRAARGEDLADGEADLNASADEIAGLLQATAAPGVKVSVAKKQDVPSLPIRSAVVNQALLALGTEALARMGDTGAVSLETSRRVPAQESGEAGALEECALLIMRDSGAPPAERAAAVQEVESLVASLGGHVSRGPEEGGTRTEVWLPTGKTGRGDLPEAGASEAAPAQRLHLLVIDDEPGIRGVCRGYLELLGHTTLEAGLAAEALEALEGATVDAVLLDVRLPDGDGVDVLAKIHALRPDLPVIVMSGDLSRHVRARFPKGTPMLPKPFLLDGLREALAGVAPGAGPAGA